MMKTSPLNWMPKTHYAPSAKNFISRSAKMGKPLIYFAGNSLGLMPKPAREIVEEELNNWAKLGVDAHHASGTPWYTYNEALRKSTARLVGAKPLEVISMNSLTVNLHLMMATFYRPASRASES
jgi:kynureninase